MKIKWGLSGKKGMTLFHIVIVFILVLSGCSSANKVDTEALKTSDTAVETALDKNETEEAVALEKDDYYEAVNGELLSQWKLDPDESVKDNFTIAEETIRERMAALIHDLSKQTDWERGSDERNIRALYFTGMDQQARNENGFGEVLSDYFSQVDQADSVDELVDISMQFSRDYGFYSIFGLTVGTDLIDSNQKVLYALVGDVGLPKEIWFSSEKENQKIVQAYEEFLYQLCLIEGYTSEQAENVSENIVVWMKKLAEKSLSQEDLYAPEKIYNVYTVPEVEALFEGRIQGAQMEEIYGIEEGEPIVIQDVEVAKQMGAMLTEDNLSLLKAYVKLCTHRDFCRYIDMDSYHAYTDYVLAASGSEEKVPWEEALLDSVETDLGFECGRLYCQAYYSEQTTEEVSKIVAQIVDVFERRIDALDWMSEQTKREAKNKLDHLIIRIGHPDVWPQDQYELVLHGPEEDGLYVDNYLELMKVVTETMFEHRKEPVDRTKWIDTPQTVNAYYDPQTNSINILAGILQEPIYDLDASEEENLGSIGMVIGHEITHAFDSTGAQFDENGNLRNWWLQEDLEKFQAREEKVVAYYDGMEIHGQQVDGRLTLGENIANLGGMACITEIAQEEGYDLAEVYEAYARFWASKEREEYLVMNIALDVHAPSKIRVNAVLSAQQAFRDLYDIQEGDGMYQKEMPVIW